MNDHDIDDENPLDALLAFLAHIDSERRVQRLIDQVTLHVAIQGYFAHDPGKVHR